MIKREKQIIYKDQISSYIVAKDQEESTGNTIKYVKNNKDELINNKEKQKTILRCIEDLVYTNRQQSLFVPKKIRDQFLKNDSDYYKELDEIKSIYWGINVTRPESPADFEVPACVLGPDGLRKNEDETNVVNLSQIHERLLTIFDDVKKVLDDNGIRFMLDGGTLIGAMRTGSFLVWDDDIDISLESKDVEKTIDILKKELKGKYEIQDYYNDPYYSPRLSRFKVRELNSKSFIDEKDSPLFEKYRSRGLFLDIYAYSPILVNKSIDTIYRKLFLYPINKKIRKKEINWKTHDKEDKYLQKFLKCKKRYMARSKWYLAHAENRDYYAYEPYYVEYSKEKPICGPYFKAEDLYGNGDVKYAEFEGRKVEIPVNYNEILKGFYGNDWEKSPFIPLDELIGEDRINFNKDMYSRNTFDASCYKHIKNAYIDGAAYKTEK